MPLTMKGQKFGYFKKRDLGSFSSWQSGLWSYVFFFTANPCSCGNRTIIHISFRQNCAVNDTQSLQNFVNID